MTQITERIRCVEVARADGLITQVYILSCEGGIILVDVGFTQLCLNNISAELREIGKGWGDVRMVLITHAHGDHIDNLERVLELAGNPEVIIGEGDEKMLEEQTGVKADAILDTGDLIGACGGIEVVRIPGHSDGNLCFYLRKERALIVGDTIFGDEDGSLYPPPEKYSSDAALAARGLSKLLNYDFDALLLSHGVNVLSGARRRVEDLVDAIV
jgi:glyoxylase-like metal-dependent hydrolase (beta-lactamase superfamily II)